MQWSVLINEKEWPTDPHNNMNESCSALLNKWSQAYTA